MAVSQTIEGYKVSGDTTVFVFNEKDYHIKNVNRVVVTGTFRNWSADMDIEEWRLSKNGKNVWYLKKENPEFKMIPPHAEFKFRINEGEWLDPPAKAPNLKGHNLVFLHEVILPALKADILHNRGIWVTVTGVARPVQKSHYRLTDAFGNIIPIADILPNEESTALLITDEEIDKRRIHYLEINHLQLRTLCTFDGWFRSLYSQKVLGAHIRENKNVTDFRIFSPRADLVKLYLYKNHNDKLPFQTIEMKADKDMVWETTVQGNLTGIFYDFTVHGPRDPGNHFYETLPKHISDPYARVNMDAWGKSMVWEKTLPAKPLSGGIPQLKDVIAYEVHIQDFTDSLPVSSELKGSFKAMAMPGLTNSHGEKIGFDYLVDLGVNVIHLMPVQEYMHHPDNIWKESFKDDPYMIEQGISEENYQWGYRTSHAFAIENKYRSKDSGHGEERNQLRDLVHAFHEKGIAVIADIVPNHTAEDMDGHWYFHFNVLDKIYYYRTRELEHIGEYGNEVKTENRPMVQKWLIDQCKHLIEEIGLDGFRIDLAGQIDRQTLIKLREAIGIDKILYGEPWIASNDSEFESNSSWDWYKHNAPITFFQDDSRNAFKGPVFNLKSKKKDRGYAGGNFEERENVMKALSNTFSDDHLPTSGINYLDIHDNWALADQFALYDWDGRKGVEESRIKIAATLLLTSLGPIVIHGGSEMLRSKGHAPLTEMVKVMKNGVKVYIHGKRDSYNLRKANQFVWENLGINEPNDYKGMVSFWQGLITLRNSATGKVFRIDVPTPPGYYHFYTPEEKCLLGYIVDEKIAVVINTGRTLSTLQDFEFPGTGKWQLIANIDAVQCLKGIQNHEYSLMNGNQSYSIDIPETGLYIWVYQDNRN